MRVDQARQQRRVPTVNEDVPGTPDSGVTDSGDAAVLNLDVEYSISDVARMAGVTSRTLRHYDDIGLLHPARVATNGYRWYGRSELLRLQRILLLRELRIPLPQIQQVLDGDTDELASLRRHRDDLAAERDRLEQIITTVDHTIADLCGTATLTDDEFFTGLATRREALRNDLKSRYGDSVDDHFASAAQATAGWTRQDHEHAAGRSGPRQPRSTHHDRGRRPPPPSLVGECDPGVRHEKTGLHPGPRRTKRARR